VVGDPDLLEPDALGRAALDAVEQARETAQVVIEHGTEAAQDAAQAATSAAKDAGQQCQGPGHASGAPRGPHTTRTEHWRCSMAGKAARDVMTPECTCVGENDSVLDAARRLAELDVGAMPICGEDDRLKGMVTDRDIAVKVVAGGKDPSSTTVGSLGQGDAQTVTIGADDPMEEALRTTTQHKVRRLPVIDGERCVGIVSQADIATTLDEEQVGELVEAISAAP
jgi:CBS domain-containing protein